MAITTRTLFHVTACQGLVERHHHAIKRILNPRVLSQVASYHVASTVHESEFLSWVASYDVVSTIHESEFLC